MKTTSDHDQPRRANNMQHNPVVSVRIDQELDRRLTALAEKTHRSRGAYLRAALTWALPHFEMQLQGDRPVVGPRRLWFGRIWKRILTRRQRRLRVLWECPVRRCTSTGVDRVGVTCRG